MTTMKDREHGFEAKFAPYEEMMFKAEAPRNKLPGHWAAELPDETGSKISDYANEVIKADFAEPGDAGVLPKVVDDLGGRASEEAVRAKMNELLALAKGQFLYETW